LCDWDYANSTCWPDLLTKYTTKSRQIDKCPSNKIFGLGMNHPDLGVWWPGASGYESVRLSSIASPSRTVVFADCGLITKATRQKASPDSWVESPNCRTSFCMRTPNNPGFYDDMHDESDTSSPWATRMVNRHLGRSTCIFLDNHAKAMAASQVGWQYPEKDARAMWDKY
jgi:hypothetical protein